MHVNGRAFGIVVMKNGRDAFLALRGSTNTLVDVDIDLLLIPEHHETTQLGITIATQHFHLMVIPLGDHLLELAEELELVAALAVGKLLVDESAREFVDDLCIAQLAVITFEHNAISAHRRG